jgi:branched-chain amino acid transport system ATP-binding protein
VSVEPATAPILEASGITKRFGGLTALNEVDLTLAIGRITSIIGPNGAGKTTLFNVFTGLYTPDAGRVTFKGRSMLGLRPDQIAAAGICRTFQNIRLFRNMTVIENVLVGMHTQTLLGLWDVLGQTRRFLQTEARLAERAGELLDTVGLASKDNEIARHLPYGDQRRLEIARALAARPALLLLDEPTAGMTQGEATGLMRLLRHLIGRFDLTVLLIEHNMRVVMEVSDQITVLDHGERIAEGEPDDIRRNARVVEAYLGRRAGA